MGRGIPLTLEDRKIIEEGLKCGFSFLKISQNLNRHISIVFYEVKRAMNFLENYTAEGAHNCVGSSTKKYFNRIKEHHQLPLFQEKSKPHIVESPKTNELPTPLHPPVYAEIFYHLRNLEQKIEALEMQMEIVCQALKGKNA